MVGRVGEIIVNIIIFQSTVLYAPRIRSVMICCLTLEIHSTQYTVPPGVVRVNFSVGHSLAELESYVLRLNVCVPLPTDEFKLKTLILRQQV